MKEIIEWLKRYSNKCGLDTFVVGISGGVDSALTSTLCAETGLKTILVSSNISFNAVISVRNGAI